MKKRFKNILKSMLPPLITNLLKAKQKTWTGNFKSWNEAIKETEGYDKENIINSLDLAMQKLINKEFKYERDSVLFDKIEYSLPLLTGIL